MHSLYTAAHGGIQTVHGRVQTVHGRARAMHMVCPCPEHGRVRSRYAAKHGRVRGPCPTVYVPYIYTAVHGPCTMHTAVYTAVFTARVHGRVRTMYTAHDPNTAVYTVMYPIHGRVYGPCTVHGP